MDPVPQNTVQTPQANPVSYSNVSQPVSSEPGGWNWGAFFLNWIWGISNGVWIALLMFIPFANFIMPFVLGAKGNKWAWKAKQWNSIEEFKAAQRRWAIAGLIVSALGLLVAGLSIYFTVQATNAPVSVAQTFVSDVENNKVDEAYSLTSPAFRLATSKDQFAVFVNRESQLLPKKPLEIFERSVSTDNGFTSAIVAGNLVGDQGVRYKVTINLVQGNKVWLVQNVDVK